MIYILTKNVLFPKQHTLFNINVYRCIYVCKPRYILDGCRALAVSCSKLFLFKIYEFMRNVFIHNLFLKLHAEGLAMMPCHYCHLICLNWWVKWGFFIDISTCVFLCLLMWSRWIKIDFALLHNYKQVFTRFCSRFDALLLKMK